MKPTLQLATWPLLLTDRQQTPTLAEELRECVVDPNGPEARYCTGNGDGDPAEIEITRHGATIHVEVACWNSYRDEDGWNRASASAYGRIIQDVKADGEIVIDAANDEAWTVLTRREQGDAVAAWIGDL